MQTTVCFEVPSCAGCRVGSDNVQWMDPSLWHRTRQLHCPKHPRADLPPWTSQAGGGGLGRRPAELPRGGGDEGAGPEDGMRSSVFAGDADVARAACTCRQHLLFHPRLVGGGGRALPGLEQLENEAPSQHPPAL